MQLDNKDMARLWDMLDAAKAATQFTQGLKYAEFLANRMIRNAVERNLEIIGEAARCVSRDVRTDLPDIPWSSMIALRNVLAHEYGDIRYERLWVVCMEDLPTLIRQLESVSIEDSTANG